MPEHAEHKQHKERDNCARNEQSAQERDPLSEAMHARTQTGASVERFADITAARFIMPLLDGAGSGRTVLERTYWDLFELRVGPAEIHFLAASEIRLVPAATESQLLSQLYSRAKA
jgi:hypothetical protein